MRTKTEIVEEKPKVPKKSVPKEGNNEDTLHAMDLMALTPLRLQLCTPFDVEERTQEYLEICIKNNKKPAISSYALALGVSRTSLLGYITGETQCPKDTREVLQRFSQMLDALLEDYMLNGKINPVSGIFIAKNNFGYKDQTEYIVNNNVGDESTPESLEEEARLLLQAEPKKANVEE